VRERESQREREKVSCAISDWYCQVFVNFGERERDRESERESARARERKRERAKEKEKE